MKNARIIKARLERLQELNREVARLKGDILLLASGSDHLDVEIESLIVPGGDFWLHKIAISNLKEKGIVTLADFEKMQFIDLIKIERVGSRSILKLQKEVDKATKKALLEKSAKVEEPLLERWEKKIWKNIE